MDVMYYTVLENTHIHMLRLRWEQKQKHVVIEKGENSVCASFTVGNYETPVNNKEENTTCK